MPRERKDPRKTRILIRMSKSERALTDSLSEAANENTSAYLRHLMKAAKARKVSEMHLKIIEQQKQVVHELLREFVRVSGKKVKK